MNRAFSNLAFTVFGASVIVLASWLAPCAVPLTASADSGYGIQVQTFPEHSRIFIPLDPSVDTQLQSTKKGFSLFIQGVSLSDLGAPLGDENAWEAQFAHTGDPRLGSLKFSEVTGGVKVQGTWKFPTGKLALANPVMETFDFRKNGGPSGSPSDSGDGNAGYILDFWLKKGSMTLSQYKTHQTEQARLAKIREEQQQRQKIADRRLASEKRQQELEDTTRFCKQPLSESGDVFLQFFPIHKTVDFRRWFPDTTPDEFVTYDHLPKEGDASDDARYVSLALDLYQQGKVALVLKTLDFLNAAHPHSQYQTWMRFLRANAMIKLGMSTQGEKILNNLMADSQDSPVALHAAMFIAEKQIERKQRLAAAQTFLWLIAHFPTYKHAWLFHLGAAESLYTLRQTDRALKEYEWVAEKAPDGASRAEGALRAPDLYLQRFQYAQALAGYYQAIHYFPEQAKNFPSVYLNRAESLYGLGQYDRAKDSFQSFLKDYPIHPEGWRATYRLGEIEGRKTGADAEKASRAEFYETINHYPFSPGSTLARLRLLPCGDHGGFDLSGAERFFDNDVESYNPIDEVDMVPFHAMAMLTQVRTLIAFGDETGAVGLATEELGKPGYVQMHDILKATLGSVFRKSILDMLAQGKAYDALAFYKSKASLLPTSSATDAAGGAPYGDETDYLLKLSQAASDLGLGDLAVEISNAYAKANPSRAVADAAEAQDLDSILVSSERHFTAGKALWVASGMKQEEAVRAQLGQVRPESPYSYQSELILGLMDQSGGKLDSALSHAVQAQLLMPAEGGANHEAPRINAWIAGLQAAAGKGPADWQAALDMYKGLEKQIRSRDAHYKNAFDPIAAELGIPPVPTLDATVLAEGRLLEKLGRWGEAASTYAKAVKEKIGGDEAVYEYARSLERTGTTENAAKALDVLKALAASDVPSASTAAAPQAPANARLPKAGVTDDFWKNLAREALADGTMEGRTQ